MKSGIKSLRHGLLPFLLATVSISLSLTLSISLCFSLSPSPAAVPEEPFTGKCISVSEGDTLQIMHHGFPENVRLGGVDAPELAQAFGPAAKKALAAAAFLKPVLVKPRGRDRAGNILAVVVVTSSNLELNATLIRNGLAWRDRQTSDTRLATLEALARKEQRGLWREHTPTPPWEFRRRQTEEAAQTYIPEASAKDPTTVYVTKMGKTYHLKDCIAVRNYIAPISLADAVNNGYTPCFACKPQEQETLQSPDKP